MEHVCTDHCSVAETVVGISQVPLLSDVLSALTIYPDTELSVRVCLPRPAVSLGL